MNDPTSNTGGWRRWGDVPGDGESANSSVPTLPINVTVLGSGALAADAHSNREYVVPGEHLFVSPPCPHVRVIGAGELRCVLGESVTPRQLSEAIALLRQCAVDVGLEGGLRGDVAAWLRENARG